MMIMIRMRANFARHIATPHCNEKKKKNNDRKLTLRHNKRRKYIRTSKDRMETMFNSLANIVIRYCMRVHVIIRQTRKESVRLIRHCSNSTISRLTLRQTRKKKKKRRRIRVKKDQDKMDIVLVIESRTRTIINKNKK